MPPTDPDLLSRPLPARPRPLQAVLLGIAAAALCGCGADGPGRRPAAVPDRVERFGDLELVTHTRAVRGGDALRYGWTTTQDWSLRRQGRPLEVQTLSGLWGDRPLVTGRLHSVFVVEPPDRSTPDLLVLVGDPNNTSAFHRIAAEAAGPPQTPLLCITTGGSNSVAWAPSWPQPPEGIGPAPIPGTAREVGTLPWAGPVLQRLQPQVHGPRVLRLGERCFYDTLTRGLQVLPPPPAHLSLITAYGPTILSPDGGMLARLAWLSGEERRPVVATTPLFTLPDSLIAGSVAAHDWLRTQPQHWQHLPIDRARMRVARLEQIDLAWMAHHWHWQRLPGAAGSADARWVLVERSGFRPLPYRGWYFQGADQYSLEGLVPGGIMKLARAVAAELGGELRPGEPRPGDLPPIPVLRVAGIDLHLSDNSFYIASSGRLAAGDPAADPQQRQALIRRVGEAVERRLASGCCDDLFRFGP